MLSKKDNHLSFKTINHKAIEKSKDVIVCKMLKTTNTAIDEAGIKSIIREVGKVYSIFPTLANKLIKAGLAIEYNPVIPEEKPEIKPKSRKRIVKK